MGWRWKCRRHPFPASVVFYVVCSSVSWEHPAVCSAAVPEGLPSYRTPLSSRTSSSRRTDRIPVESRSSDLGLTVLPTPCGDETGPHCSALCNTLETCTFIRHLKEEEKKKKKKLLTTTKQYTLQAKENQITVVVGCRKGQHHQCRPSMT